MQQLTMSMKNLFQTADWKTEKHVPVIDAPDSVNKGEFFTVTASIGKEVAHPNTTQHHICWIQLFFKPEGAKFPYEIGKAEFTAHGASTDGPDTSSIYTNHSVSMSFKTDQSGTIMATSYCNIHGLWENSKELSVR